MKKHYFTFSNDWQNAPLAYWVHIETDGLPWYDAQMFNPPPPRPCSPDTYKILNIEYNGFTFIFSSQEQLQRFIEILKQKNLPTTRKLSQQRPGAHALNTHWLGRLPAKTKSWKFREGLIRYYEKIKNEIDF